MALLNRVYLIAEDAMTERLETGIAITRVNSDRLHVLNSTGCAIWELVDGQTTLGEIISCLAIRFGKSPESISNDVLALIDRMLDVGLVVEKP